MDSNESIEEIKLKKRTMNGLEAFKFISGFTNFQNGWYKDKLDAIEKELKALEIINVKTVNVMYFKGSASLEEYNSHHATWHKLTQDEFDLLKEILQ